ncbi:MAG: hypothetical protein AAF441_09675 [Pseudomonadota bacterium]
MVRQSNLFRLLLLSLMVCLFQATASAETVELKKAGVAFEAPDGWHRIGAKELDKTLKDSDFGTEELNEGVRASTDTLVTLVKNRFMLTGINPSISVSQYPGNIVDIKAAMGAVRQFAAKARKFEQVGEFAYNDLGEFPAGHMIFKYVLVLKGAVELDVQEELWVIPMGANYLTVSVGYAPTSEPETVDTIRKSVATLRKLN